MARWETQLEYQGSGEETSLLNAGWEPIGIGSIEIVDWHGNERVHRQVPATLLRRRVPEPLRPCEWCKYRVDTGRRICLKTNRVVFDATPDTRDHPRRYECHRHPAVMLHTEDGYGDEHRPSANGMGCGEWEAANG